MTHRLDKPSIDVANDCADYPGDVVTLLGLPSEGVEVVLLLSPEAALAYAALLTAKATELLGGAVRPVARPHRGRGGIEVVREGMNKRLDS